MKTRLRFELFLSILLLAGTIMSAAGSYMRGWPWMTVVFATLGASTLVAAGLYLYAIDQLNKSILIEDVGAVELLREQGDRPGCVCCPNSDRHIFGTRIHWCRGEAPYDQIARTLRENPELDGSRIQFTLRVLPPVRGAK